MAQRVGPRPSDGVRNLAAYSLSELFWGLAWSLSFESPMVAAFARSAGHGESDVGIIWLLFGLGLCTPMLFADWFTAPLRTKRAPIAWGHGGAALLLLALAGLEHVLPAEALRVAHFIITFAFAFLIGIQAPAWFGLVGDLFPQRKQAPVLATAFVLNRFGALIGGWLATYFLAQARPWGITFLVAGLAGLVGCLPYALLLERPRAPRDRPPMRRHLAGMLRVWRRSTNLRRFVWVDGLSMAHAVVLAHFAAAAFARDGHPRVLAGTFTQMMAVGMLTCCFLVVVAGPRMASRRGLQLALGLGVAGGVGAAFGGGAWVYFVVAFAVGGIGGLRMSCIAPTLMPLVARRERTRALGMHGFVSMGLLGILPMVGGWIAASAGYPWLFGVAATLSLVAALAFAVLLPPPPA